MATRENALTIDSIHDKLNHRYEKIKIKKEEKIEKEKALNVYNKQYKQRCRRCEKYDHKPGDRRCPKNKNEKEENEKKVKQKNRKFEEICYHCEQKGHISRDCQAWKNGHYKKFEKAERAIDGDGDGLVLYSLMSECKTKKLKEKSSVCRRCETALQGWYDVYHQW